jgi:hypothetical protein
MVSLLFVVFSYIVYILSTFEFPEVVFGRWHEFEVDWYDYAVDLFNNTG